MADNKEKLYGTVQAAPLLGVKVRTVRQWIRDGKLKAFKLPGSIRWKVSESEIQRILNNKTEG